LVAWGLGVGNGTHIFKNDMAKFFKKIGQGIKKVAKSKVGKIIGVAAGIGLTAVGVGAGIKAIKVAKAVKGAHTAAKAAKAVSTGQKVLSFAKPHFGAKTNIDFPTLRKGIPIASSSTR